MTIAVQRRTGRPQRASGPFRFLVARRLGADRSRSRSLPLGGLVYFARARLRRRLAAPGRQRAAACAPHDRAAARSASARWSRSIGVGTAWLVTMFRFPGRRVFEWALLLPLAVPTYIIAYAYLDVLHPIGPVQTTLRELLGIARPRDLWFPEIRSLARLHLPARRRALPLRLPAGPRALPDAVGGDAGGGAHARRRTGSRVFFRVALPLARPAIAVGVSLALMEALNDIGASEFLGVRTLTVAIYTTWTMRMSVEGAAQIALVMLAVVFALILLERWARRRQRYSAHGAAPSHADAAAARRLGGARRRCSPACCRSSSASSCRRAISSSRRGGAISCAGLPRALPDWIGNSAAARRDRDGRRDRRRPRRSPIPCACRATRAAPILVRLASHRLRGARHRARRRPARAARLARQCASTPSCARPSASRPGCSSPARARRWSSPTCSASSPSPPAAIEAGLAKVSPHLDMAARSLGSRPGEDPARHPPAADRARRSPPRRCWSSSTA